MPQEELPRFLRMLFTMVGDPACNPVIRWAHEGTAFQILDADYLSSQVLAVYYTPQKFSSFQRQLNYFGFRKWTKTQTDVCTFSHPDFLEYDQTRLWQIRRGKRTAPTPSYFSTPKNVPAMSWSQLATPAHNASQDWSNDTPPRMSIPKKVQPIITPLAGNKRSFVTEFDTSVQPKRMVKAEPEYVNSDNYLSNEMLQTLVPAKEDFLLFHNESTPLPIENNATNGLDVMLKDDSAEVVIKANKNNNLEMLDFDWKSFLHAGSANQPAC